MKKLFLILLMLLSGTLIVVAGNKSQKETSEFIASYLQLKKTAQWNGKITPQIVSLPTMPFSLQTSLHEMAYMKAQCLMLQKETALEKKYRHQNK